MHAGKLFPGPHLYAGAAIVVLWASASALVPSMQKGNDTARNIHIALNTLNLALFAWQVRLVLGPPGTYSANCTAVWLSCILPLQGSRSGKMEAEVHSLPSYGNAVSRPQRLPLMQQ